MMYDDFEGLENVFLTLEGKNITNTIEIMPSFNELIENGKSFNLRTIKKCAQQPARKVRV